MSRMLMHAVPARITLALDAAGLHGPEVDEKCGVAEPAVDLWELGVLLPTREQVTALAALTGQPVDFFYLLEAFPDGRTFICDRSRRGSRGLTVIEPGQIGTPVCPVPDCGEPVWASVPGPDGEPVLIERPDLFGSLVMARIGKPGRSRTSAWGARPLARGETAPGQLRRRPHECRVFAGTCTVPAGEGGAACGKPASLFPEGWRCADHDPSSHAAQFRRTP